MFSAWGRFVYRHRRLVAIVTLVLAAGSGIFAILAPLDTNENVLGVFRWTLQTPDPALVSQDGTATYAVVQLQMGDEASIPGRPAPTPA